jgi:hypothetical protein
MVQAAAEVVLRAVVTATVLDLDSAKVLAQWMNGMTEMSDDRGSGRGFGNGSGEAEGEATGYGHAVGMGDGRGSSEGCYDGISCSWVRAPGQGYGWGSGLG